MEELEERFFLSAASILPAISPTWFEDYSLAGTLRHANPAGLSIDGSSSSDELVWADGSDTNVYDWIVHFDTKVLDGVTSAAQSASLLVGGGAEFEVLRGLGLVGQVLVRSSGTSIESVDAWLASNSNVASYELDLVRQLQATTPNDPNMSSLWGLENTGQTGGTVDADIDATAAWDISTGSSSIVVGVIDTGVDYTHADLAANIWTNPGEIAGNGIDDDGNGFVDDVHGYDFINDDSDPMDDNGHGTHVSGTIAAVGNDGAGIAGVNWSSSIMALKFLSSGGSGYLSDAVRAINYTTMMRTQYDVNIRVTNNSWGGGGFSTAMYNAIQANNDAGILFAAAAGNSGSNNDVSPHYPSNYANANVISVAATDHNDNLAYFSCYGVTSVDLAAPGVSVYSTVPGNSYARYSGTSMATPHVAGVAALAWSAAPEATVAEIRDALLQGTDLLASLSGKVATGGRLNALGTLEFLTDPGPRAPLVGSLTISPNPVSEGTVVTLTASAVSDSDGTVSSVSFYRDSNANSQFDDTDELLGVDTTVVDSQASITLDTTGYAAGNHVLFARALDNDSQWSRAAAGTLTLIPPDDHGDSAAAATVVPGGQTVVAGTIGHGGDVDWFAFEAAAGMVYTLETELVGLPDSVLYLYDQDGTTLIDWNDDISWPENPGSRIVWTATGGGMYYLAVEAYSNSQTGDYNLHVTFEEPAPPPPTDLGTVDFLQIADLNLLAGDYQYSLQTTHQAYLTIEAFFVGSADSVQITLYDEGHNELTTSPPSDDGERIDWEVSAQTTYLVVVSGNLADVDLRLSNLVHEDGNTVTVYGTDGDDSFTFAAGDPHQIVINDVEYTFDSSVVANFQFDGGTGRDMAVLTGLAGDDTARLYSTHATLTGPGYAVQLANLANTTIYGGGGTDTAHLYDSAGDDTFRATPTFGLMHTAVFYNLACNFRYVYAYSTGGGTDQAYLHDSAGDDTFIATPTYGELHGDGFDNKAEGFRYVFAYSTEGGTDTANFYDSVGDDYFSSAPTYSTLYSHVDNPLTFYHRASGFRHVYAYSTAGGADRAFFYDSAGDDTLVATPTYAKLYGDGFDNRAEGFRYTYTYAREGGTDTAYLYDSAGNDYFSGTPTHGMMYGDAFYNMAYGFRYVYGYATAGGTDRATMTDSAGDDTFVATPTYAELYGDGFYNKAEGFRYVHAFSTAGGTDTAYLYDSAGNDVFNGTSTYGLMYGDAFYNYARNFRYVNAYSTAGGTDKAYLYDSAGTDTFIGRPTYGRLYGDGFDNKAEGFRYVYAYSTAGGADRAYLHDSAGNDRFTGRSTYSELYGNGFYNRAQGFRYVYAYATAGGTDRAYLFDSAGNDTFVGTKTYGKLYNSTYYNLASKFRYVYAYSTAGGTDKAYLYDSAGNDTFVATPSYGKLFNGSYYNLASNFRYVYAYSTAGGTDRAYLYDSAGNDRFTGRSTQSVLYGSDFYNLARGFRYVNAYSTAGGTDRAYLFDSAGDDRFVGRPTYSQLYGNGFYNLASRFRYVYAYSTAGGTDKAYLYDSAGNDTFVGTPTLGKIFNSTYYNLASRFRYVYAFATAGGTDTAHLLDSAGDDTFVGTSTSGKLLGRGFCNLTRYFEHVHAYATGGGNDKAYVFDSAGDDHFEAAGNRASMSYAQAFLSVADFSWVRAVSEAGGQDTRDVQAVDFVLEFEGPYWVDN